MTPSFEAGTVQLKGGLRVGAPPDHVFPLFSPLGERAWVPGWDPEILYPHGASWTRGMVFRTRSDSGDALWIVTRLDPDAHEVEYRRVEPGRYVVRISVRCTADPAPGTAVSIEYEFVGLSESGNAEIAAMTQEGYAQKMRQWEAWIAAALKRDRPAEPTA